MRRLELRGTRDIPSAGVFSVLQLCTVNKPLIPNLKTLDLWRAEGWFIPFIPLFLSPGTTVVRLVFIGSAVPKSMVASIVTALPILCPNLQCISLSWPLNDPIITTAVSGMLLATNRNTLRSFRVDSPLTKEAREVIYRLPNLYELSTVIEKDTPLPPAVLPNLTDLTITYDDGDDWMQLFHGATLQKLETVDFYTQSRQIGDFLGAFAKMVLATSVQKTLSAFSLSTSCSWNPNYRSLLPFIQMKDLVIEFSCNDGCSSRVDDDVIIDLARAMPKLETLHLGDTPCRQIPVGVTAKGLLALASHCLDLSTVRIHFQVDSLSATPAAAGMTSDAGSITPRRDCALRELEVGDIFVPEESVLMVALTLARIFPHIESIDVTEETWDKVVDAIRDSRRIVDHLSKEHLPPAIFRSNPDDISAGTTFESG